MKETTTVLFPSETILSVFFERKTFTNQKISPNKKTSHHQPKKLSPNPLYPISSESKTKRDFQRFTNHLPLLQPSLRLWCSYQGKDVDYRRPRSKAMEKTQGRAAEGLWLTAQLLIFFGWMEKKENL